MRLYSYVVARDYGFAPNPFYGVCTLATCKPQLRRMASVGDWVIGTGCAPNGLTGHLVYVMKVAKIISFDEYFDGPQYAAKKPNLAGSLKQAFGDNIYRSTASGWHQLDSHHSLEDGSPNPENVSNDTNPNRVLVAEEFTYFGEDAPKIPDDVRFHAGEDLCALRLYKVNFEAAHVAKFIDWYCGLQVTGLQGRPFEWRKNGALRRDA